RFATLCIGRLLDVTLLTNMTHIRRSPPMHDDEQHPRSPLNPTALSVEEAALVLTRTSGQTVTESMIQEDIAKGASTNADGTLNLVHYAAWLVKEMAGGD
ncbi:MAG: hypothetical protein K8R46_04725, partial [Pirellulales bacterium]|nr:hypothetical protein [Pirellulales bacterium]